MIFALPVSHSNKGVGIGGGGNWKGVNDNDFL